jgi:hypothetical protein
LYSCVKKFQDPDRCRICIIIRIFRGDIPQIKKIVPGKEGVTGHQPREEALAAL